MFNVLVQLLVPPRSLCGIEIASPNDVTVSRIEIKGIRNVFKFAQRQELVGE